MGFHQDHVSKLNEDAGTTQVNKQMKAREYTLEQNYS